MPGRLVPATWKFDPTLNAPAKYRRACRYDAFVPVELGSLKVDLPVSTAGLVSEAERAIRSLNAEGRPALAPMARLLLRTESIASSKVEGLQMGARALARAEVRMDTGGRPSTTASEILANMAAMETAVTQAAAAAPFGSANILEIHGRLMTHGMASSIAGRFRNSQNWIGGNDYNPCRADFVPPPVEEVPRLLADLCGAINDDLLPPLVQAALVHAQFETIHPFDDGNGRTGRALIHVVLRRRGLAPDYVPPVSVVLAAGRKRYIDGLTKYRGDGVVEWIEHFAAAADRSAKLASRYLGQVEELMQDWREKLTKSGAPRADAAAWAVLQVLPAHPVITGPVAVAATSRSRGPVYEALSQLQEAKVLLPLSSSQRNRAWEAAGLLDLLEALDSGRLTGTP
jgi:Fic family protein